MRSLPIALAVRGASPNWTILSLQERRANLVRLLQEEAIQVARLLRAEGGDHRGCARRVLAQHGVIAKND
jgi:hypothetical protein